MTVTTKPFLVSLSYHPSHGQSTYTVACSNCGHVFQIYVWSFHGCGKKCPECKQFYSFYDMQKPERIKYKGAWAYSVGKWILVLLNGRWITVDPEHEDLGIVKQKTVQVTAPCSTCGKELHYVEGMGWSHSGNEELDHPALPVPDQLKRTEESRS